MRFSTDYPISMYQPVLREAYVDAAHREPTFVGPEPESIDQTRLLVAEAVTVREKDKPGGYRRRVLQRRRAERS